MGWVIVSCWLVAARSFFLVTAVPVTQSTTFLRAARISVECTFSAEQFLSRFAAARTTASLLGCWGSPAALSRHAREHCEPAQPQGKEPATEAASSSSSTKVPARAAATAEAGSTVFRASLAPLAET